MKLQHFFSKVVKFTMAALLSSHCLFAQVKIGKNPAIIGSTNNLEIEADNSKKVIVHKDNGSVVIENIPVGTATDKIVTADINGNIHSITTGLSGSMASKTPQSLAAGGYQGVDFTTIINDP